MAAEPPEYVDPIERFAPVLDRAREVATSLLAPRATESDLADSPPIENIRSLATAGLMGLTTPVRFGGLGVPGAVLRAYSELLASACGVTTFVQGQHQSAAMLIATGENESLKETLLPSMATGESLCGVAFSHLRRMGPPTMRAEPRGDGFLLNGEAPWVTGWDVMTEVVIGGTLPDGRLLYGVVPLRDDESMRPSPPMRLCAMNASGTVSLTCRDLFIGPDRYLKIITREQMARNDVSAILALTAQPFGVARASADWIRGLAAGRKNALFQRTADALGNEIDLLRAESEHWIACESHPEYKQNALRIRAQAIELGIRAAHAAVAASAGGANNLSHPAQRYFREAMFYTLTAQTPDVQAATLEQIASRSLTPI